MILLSPDSLFSTLRIVGGNSLNELIPVLIPAQHDGCFFSLQTEYFCCCFVFRLRARRAHDSHLSLEPATAGRETEVTPRLGETSLKF